MEIRRIVVGVDGSANAARGQRWAADLATALDAEVVALHAVGLLSHLVEGGVVPSEQHKDELRRLFEDEWTRPLRDSGVRYRTVARDGNPVTAILRVAEDEDADLIVLGSRGQGGFSELHLGSTSQQVAQYAPRPVVIVPPAVRAPIRGGHDA